MTEERSPACEFYAWRHKGPDRIPICTLTGRPCFVNEPDTDLGRACQTNCTRRTWALESEAKAAKSSESPG